MSGFRFVTTLVGCAVLLGVGQVAEAQGCVSAACTGDSVVDHLFTSGTRWRFNVRNCPCEGLFIEAASFTPRGGVARRVLGQASLAEIHVPYLVGTPRFLDLSRDSAGLGVSALPWSAAECAGGTRLANDTICLNVEDRGLAWKYLNTSQRGESLSVTMASQLGAYTYINQWEFHDDGTIEPRMGLTGRLARYGGSDAYAPYGRRLNAQSAATPDYGLSHMHNVYYRLDFDIGGAADDAVERMTFQPSSAASPVNACTTPGACGVNVLTPLLTETAQDFSADAYTTWRIYDKNQLNNDGRTVSYELVPQVEGVWSGQVSTDEPWSEHEVWVTRYNACETLAVGNFPPHINAGCATAKQNVSAMVDGQSVDGQDVVVWYVNRHLHTPRDEDEVNMPIEWMSFMIKPRGFHHRSPLEP